MSYRKRSHTRKKAGGFGSKRKMAKGGLVRVKKKPLTKNKKNKSISNTSGASPSTLGSINNTIFGTQIKDFYN